MARDTGLVQRLISFLKKPNALEYDGQSSVHNPYDDYQPRDYHEPESAELPAVQTAAETSPGESLVNDNAHVPGHGSTLDALVVRALRQFHASVGFVLRYDERGRMHYCTGRDFQGRYIQHTEVNPDRRALFLALDTGQSQLFVQADGDTPNAVLCGPLWANNEVIGVLYVDRPARSHLYRGVFDVFCDQAARLLTDHAD